MASLPQKGQLTARAKFHRDPIALPPPIKKEKEHNQSERVRERLLRERELTLDKALEVCQINEQSEEQLKVLNDVQSIKTIGKHNKSGNYRRRDNKQEQVLCCGKCGKSHPAKECPAFHKKCFKCDKKNHFAKFRKSKKIHAVDKASTDDEPLFIGAVNSIHNEENVFKTLSIEGNEIKFKIDTGSQANIIPLLIFEKMKLKQRPG
jgi:hypothetical protein